MMTTWFCAACYALTTVAMQLGRTQSYHMLLSMTPPIWCLATLVHLWIITTSTTSNQVITLSIYVNICCILLNMNVYLRQLIKPILISICCTLILSTVTTSFIAHHTFIHVLIASSLIVLLGVACIQSLLCLQQSTRLQRSLPPIQSLPLETRVKYLRQCAQYGLVITSIMLFNTNIENTLKIWDWGIASKIMLSLVLWCFFAYIICKPNQSTRHNKPSWLFLLSLSIVLCAGLMCLITR